MGDDIILYGYWRSSAAYRVRICLNLKQLAYDSVSVHLVRNGGEQHNEQYHDLNASELVPVLVDGDLRLNQSFAIIQYLEENYPDVSVIPEQTPLRYQALAMAQDIAMEIHPLNNLRVLQYLEGTLGCEQAQKEEWIHHWIKQGFAALEEKLAKYREEHGNCKYSVTDSPCIVDICLVPQVYNAQRFGVDMSPYPVINAIVDACNQLPTFIDAMPDNQPDANA
ncbi:maleylacetoacetate isomerase [Vibrio parahaemolyticus]|uniref:maleylacetoacetate isomerase n=1 Tax=Vibrio parahaemolyticus TaxID=670 RepID=UPI001122493B|nr:maleylacetoacetate isomerase [Vibrio parahaemolyticus]MBE4136218.1 maleylacetoacetate isomerase [Vibrio parahaemolyticus]MCG0033129.1 maleylacetoacetate isomerase [Vibrio parahaemolyticus]MCX8945162.1 maleylacetoacetate isomerase [Vibrio parahaemolyticus]MDL2015620.1 maleylacetoacetate isomerase [Vibrio parahaemolyticus]MDL2037617.1 maleylacetoacetate isomerase [Vibrio parahaemolyticus]